MDPVAIVIIVVGAMIALSRAPLIFAPLEVRDFYLRLLATDRHMRLIGLGVALLGGACIWVTQGRSGMPADAVYAFGLFFLLAGTFFFVLFAHWARKLAASIWGNFGKATLRAIGVTSATAGIALVYYGLSI